MSWLSTKGKVAGRGVISSSPRASPETVGARITDEELDDIEAVLSTPDLSLDGWVRVQEEKASSTPSGRVFFKLDQDTKEIRMVGSVVLVGVTPEVALEALYSPATRASWDRVSLTSIKDLLDLGGGSQLRYETHRPPFPMKRRDMVYASRIRRKRFDGADRIVLACRSCKHEHVVHG